MRNQDLATIEGQEFSFFTDIFFVLDMQFTTFIQKCMDRITKY